MAAGVGVAVVGGDQDLPVLLGVGGAGLDGGEELTDEGVDAADGVEVLPAGGAVGVAGGVDLAEVDEGGVGVAVAQLGGGGRGDLRVLVAVAVAVSLEGEALVGLGGEDGAVLVGGGEGLPVGGRIGVEAGLAFSARVRKSGWAVKFLPVKELSFTPCWSGQTPVAMVDQPGPEEVAAMGLA